MIFIRADITSQTNNMDTFVFNLVCAVSGCIIQTFVVTAGSEDAARNAVLRSSEYIDLQDDWDETELIHNEDPVFITVR